MATGGEGGGGGKSSRPVGPKEGVKGDRGSNALQGAEGVRFKKEKRVPTAGRGVKYGVGGQVRRATGEEV